MGKGRESKKERETGRGRQREEDREVVRMPLDWHQFGSLAKQLSNHFVLLSERLKIIVPLPQKPNRRQQQQLQQQLEP